MRRISMLCFVYGAFCCVAVRSVSADPAATVLFSDQAVKLDRALIEGDALWVTPTDLTRINHFELKPQGVCRDEFCVPIGRKPEDGFIRADQGQEYFNLSKLAGKLNEAEVVDREHRVWSFGPLPAAGTVAPDSIEAPDFTLSNRQGKPVRLADFRGKKVLVITWASW